MRCLSCYQILIDLVVLVASILDKVQIGQVEVSKLVVLPVDPEHEIDELVQQHEAMLKANIVAQIVQVQRQRFLEFRNQETEIQTVLDLRLRSYLGVVQHRVFVLLVANLFPEEHLWLR